MSIESFFVRQKELRLGTPSAEFLARMKAQVGRAWGFWPFRQPKRPFYGKVGGSLFQITRFPTGMGFRIEGSVVEGGQGALIHYKISPSPAGLIFQGIFIALNPAIMLLGTQFLIHPMTAVLHEYRFALLACCAIACIIMAADFIMLRRLRNRFQRFVRAIEATDYAIAQDAPSA
jgi:hypothetical protein